jgi:hypothetical protein
MPFLSLSDAIKSHTQNNDRNRLNNAPLRSTTSLYQSPLIAANQNQDTEINVLVWGSSTWGIEKVTADYKPLDQ